MTRDLDHLFDALSRSRFRARFRLGYRDGAYLRSRGIDEVMRHARSFVEERLAPAYPPRDGRQTPMRGHPAFVAQHATGTCCRSCLAKWHGIASGHPLSSAEVDHVLAAIRRWLSRSAADEMPAATQDSDQPRLL